MFFNFVSKPVWFKFSSIFSSASNLPCSTCVLRHCGSSMITYVCFVVRFRQAIVTGGRKTLVAAGMRAVRSCYGGSRII